MTPQYPFKVTGGIGTVIERPIQKGKLSWFGASLPCHSNHENDHRSNCRCISKYSRSSPQVRQSCPQVRNGRFLCKKRSLRVRSNMIQITRMMNGEKKTFQICRNYWIRAKKLKKLKSKRISSATFVCRRCWTESPWPGDYVHSSKPRQIYRTILPWQAQATSISMASIELSKCLCGRGEAPNYILG